MQSSQTPVLAGLTLPRNLLPSTEIATLRVQAFCDVTVWRDRRDQIQRMRAIVRDQYGSPDVLQLEEIAQPEVDDCDQLARVRAA